ncbi:unnamed protein product [Tuber aestivum]|uniref:Uncharacterized protein n=1 Tax=Tuber aestivum TaxID=59557 RepID=A0A292PW22_9PEZI|nr:unnamed protein product [Tuber aestivum]
MQNQIVSRPNPMLEVKEQYHHFIPRFVLRAFAARPQPDYDDPPRPVRKKKNQQRKKKPAKRTARDTQDPSGQISLGPDAIAEAATPGVVEDDSLDEAGPSSAPRELAPTAETEPVKDKVQPKLRKQRFDPALDPYIKLYDLESGVLDFRKVGRAYGIPDMYIDVDHEKVNHIEVLLSKLESSVASIYHRIKKGHEGGTYEFSISRKEVNLLRKFLFVMRYRNYKFWSKYTGTIDNYEYNDRHLLVPFLKERSITDLRQVWLQNLEVILRTEIDADGEWLDTIGREMFSGDADMYVFHMRESYMAFCEPESLEDEFIITDNGFGIFEGPVVYDVFDLKGTGADGSRPQLKDPTYTEYHKLAPLTPRLILVLRSNFLRDGPLWQKRLKFFRDLKTWPESDSLLQGLPIKPPKTHYWLPGRTKAVHTLEDEFFFEIHKANTKEVHIINTVMLQEATRAITWVSDESLVRSLKAFLGNPRFMLGTPLTILPEFLPLMALRYQKERLLSLWDKPYPSEGMRPIDEFRRMNEFTRNIKELQSYFKLGGAPELYFYDFHQAKLLTDFRSFIADHSGSEIPWRNKVNKATFKFMATFHPRIVWIHVKFWRVMANRVRTGQQDSPLTDSQLDVIKEFGPEDLVANLLDFLPFRVRSGIMIETSLKGVMRLSKRDELIAQGESGAELESSLMFLDMDIMRQFGGFGGSWSVVNTPYYSEPVDFHDPFTPEIPHVLLTEYFRHDLLLRFRLRGNIEKIILGTRGTPEAHRRLSQLLWDHLYPIPEPT